MGDIMTKLKSCPFCGVAPTPIDETNFPGDFEHPWEHKGCWLDGVPIRNTTAWNRREQLGQQAAASGVDVATGLEMAAALLDENAQYFNRIRDPGMANHDRSMAKKIRALAVAPPPVRSEDNHDLSGAAAAERNKIGFEPGKIGD